MLKLLGSWETSHSLSLHVSSGPVRDAVEGSQTYSMGPPSNGATHVALQLCPLYSSKQSVAFTPTPEGMPSVQRTRTVTVVVSEVVLDVVVAVKVVVVLWTQLGGVPTKTSPSVLAVQV